MSAWSKIIMSLPVAERITHIERRMIEMIADGMINKEMAPILGYTEMSTDNIRIRLIKKVEAKNTAHLVSIAYREGILKTK